MPFTLAHPAAAIPLTRLLGRLGCMPALAIGSMMPDLPFFLGIKLAREDTHGLVALLSWSLPAGLLMLCLFHLLFRQALVELAPAALQQRMPRPDPLPRSGLGWAAIAVSLLAGAATHLFWDAFTHPGTLFVASLPLLQIEVGSVAGNPVHVFTLLQHASTALGLALLALWAWRWFSRTPPVPAAPALSATARVCLCLVLSVVPVAAGGWTAWHGGWDFGRLARFIFTTLPVFFWMLTAYSLVRALARAQKKPAQGRL